MVSILRRFRRILLYSSFALAAQFSLLSPAEELSRTFRNQSGAELEAVLLDVIDGKKVKIRRSSDQQEFELDIDRLSEKDQQYIHDFLLNRKAKESAHTLLIEKNHPSDTVSLYSRPSAETRFDYLQHTGESKFFVTDHSWLSYQSKDNSAQLFISFQGEKHWSVSIDQNRITWLQRDLGTPKIAGIHIPPSSSPRFQDHFQKTLQVLQTSDLDEVLHVTIEDPEDLRLISQINVNSALSISLPTYSGPEAGKTSMVPNRADLQKLSGKKVVAINLDLAPTDFDLIQSLPDLELLSVGIRSLDEKEGVVFNRKSRLKHLVITRGSERLDWQQSLQNLPNLQTLACNQSFGTKAKTGFALTTLSANPNLDFLSLKGHAAQELTPTIVKSASGLVFLDIAIRNNPNFSKESDFECFHDLKNLVQLNLDTGSFPPDVFDAWCEKGGLANLRSFRGSLIPDLSQLAKLESLHLRNVLQSGDIDFRRLKSAPKTLVWLTTDGLDARSSRKLAGSIPQTIESVCIGTAEFNDFEFLRELPRLRVLEVSARDTHGFKGTLDLKLWPTLEYLALSNHPNLEQIKGLSSHPGLRYVSLWLRDCPLTTLGESVPNDRIQFLRIACRSETLDSSALTKISECTDLMLVGVPFSFHEAFISKNPLERISVTDCHGAPDMKITPYSNE